MRCTFLVLSCNTLAGSSAHIQYARVLSPFVSLQPFLVVLDPLIYSPTKFSELGLKPFLSRTAQKSLQARLLDILGLVGEALERGGNHREYLVRSNFLSNHGVTNH